MTSSRLGVIVSYLAQKLDGGAGPAYASAQFETLVGAVRHLGVADDESELTLLGRLTLAALVDHLRASVSAERLLEKVSERPSDPLG